LAVNYNTLLSDIYFSFIERTTASAVFSSGSTPAGLDVRAGCSPVGKQTRAGMWMRFINKTS
jgi:hypothetical protein